MPNYIAMSSGSAQGITDDSDPSAHPVNVASIFLQLGSGWRSLEESMRSSCYLNSSGHYAVRHHPATYYTNIRTSCQAQDVPPANTPCRRVYLRHARPVPRHAFLLVRQRRHLGGQERRQLAIGLPAQRTGSTQYQAGRTAGERVLGDVDANDAVRVDAAEQDVLAADGDNAGGADVALTWR